LKTIHPLILIVLFFISVIFISAPAEAQGHLSMMNPALEAYFQKVVDSVRRANYYAYRKYSLSLSWNPYTSVSTGQKVVFYKSIDITFSDRLLWLNVGKNASMEASWGIGFVPYQGTKLNFSIDYELLSKRIQVNLFTGLKYSLGLAQLTALDDFSSVKLGFHNYLTPFIGLVWWPGKTDILDTSRVKRAQFKSPTFSQLIYFKVQVGYSFLISALQVDTTGAVSNQLYQTIRNNTANTICIALTIGINIPTDGKERREYYQFLRKKQLLETR
jgi:hypothetical protein